jgi:hypothetical protein
MRIILPYEDFGLFSKAIFLYGFVQRIRFSKVDERGHDERRGWSITANPWKEERFE